MDDVIARLSNSIKGERYEGRGSDHLVLSRKSLIRAYGASLHQPLRLSELWDALTVPEKKDHELLSRDPFWTHQVQIDNWSQFHRSLLDLCGPLLGFLPPKNVEQQVRRSTEHRVGENKILSR